LPKGTSAQRLSATNGMLRYNTELNKPEIYNGTGWMTLGNPFGQYGRPYYNEAARADLFVGNWNRSNNYTMSEKTDSARVSKHTTALRNMVLDLKMSYNTLNNGNQSEEEFQCNQLITEISIIESQLLELFAEKESEV
jgi:hypothetical protein